MTGWPCADLMSLPPSGFTSESNTTSQMTNNFTCMISPLYFFCHVPPSLFGFQLQLFSNLLHNYASGIVPLVCECRIHPTGMHRHEYRGSYPTSCYFSFQLSSKLSYLHLYFQ